MRSVKRAMAHGMRLAAMLAGAALGHAAWAEASGDSAKGVPPPAVEAVNASLNVERILLKEDFEEHERLAAERGRIASRLAEAYAELDAAVKRTDLAVPRLVEEARAKIEQGESERGDLLASERAVLGRIQDRFRRIRLLEEQVAALQDRMLEEAGPLAGKWDVALLPSEQRGTFVLNQTGTLVSGTYQLEGGWSGSLQGTLVNRKVLLERIDSKLGRSAEFEGYLSPDGARIRGTWRSYDLSRDAVASGQWSAVRRTPGP